MPLIWKLLFLPTSRACLPSYTHPAVSINCGVLFAGVLQIKGLVALVFEFHIKAANVWKLLYEPLEPREGEPSLPN